MTSPLGSSVHEISQARVLEWGAIPFSRGSSWPRDWTWVSCITGRFFIYWATWEAPKYIIFSKSPSQVNLKLRIKSIILFPTNHNISNLFFLKILIFYYNLVSFIKHLTSACYAMLSCVQLFATPWTVPHQVPLSMGILQARTLEWVSMSSSRASSQTRDLTQVSSALQADSLLSGLPGKPSFSLIRNNNTRWTIITYSNHFKLQKMKFYI